MIVVFASSVPSVSAGALSGGCSFAKRMQNRMKATETAHIESAPAKNDDQSIYALLSKGGGRESIRGTGRLNRPTVAGSGPTTGSVVFELNFPVTGTLVTVS